MSRWFESLVMTLMCALPLRLAMSSDAIADAFIQDTVATYRAMSSYQDRGRSVQTLKSTPDDDEPAMATVDFATAFRRPNKIRFSWTKTYNFMDDRAPSKEELGSDGSKVWSWNSTDSAPEAEESIGMAVAGATGVTYGAAHMIPRLLTDDVHGFRIDQLKHLKILRSERLEGIDCYVLHGLKFEIEVELWIGKEDHLIRKRIETRPDGNTNTFQLEHIAIGADIADAEFALHGMQGK